MSIKLPIRRLFLLCGWLGTIMLSSCLAHAQNSLCGVAKLPENAADFYPPIAKAAHVGGDVVLLASFDHDGRLINSRAITGPEMLRESANRLLRSLSAGPSVGSRECPITVQFRLTEEEFDDNCKEKNPPVSTAVIVSPNAIQITTQGRGTCDPTATITKICRRFLGITYHCSKSVEQINE